MKSQDKEAELDPFLCNCGKCKRYWKDLGQNGLINKPVHERTKDTSILHNTSGLVKIGDRVIVRGAHKGFVKFVGVLDEHVLVPDLYVGVHLDENINSVHDGVYNGKHYFHVPPGHAAMVPYGQVGVISKPVQRPPVSGNYMYPSYHEIQRRRRLRSRSDPGIGFVASSTRTNPQSSTAATTRNHTGEGRPTGLRRPQDTPRRVIFDSNDIAVKDYEKERKKKQQQPKPKGESLPPSIIPDKRVSQIHEKFGGDERAAVMIETLKKLYLGLERGREFQYRQNHRRKTDAGDWSLSEED